MAWQRRQSLLDIPSPSPGARILCGEWQSEQVGIWCGASSQSRPSMIFWWTSSIRTWHFMQVPAMFPRATDERLSVCGRARCAEWQEVQTAVTVSPFL